MQFRSIPTLLALLAMPALSMATNQPKGHHNDSPGNSHSTAQSNANANAKSNAVAGAAAISSSIAAGGAGGHAEQTATGGTAEQSLANTNTAMGGSGGAGGDGGQGGTGGTANQSQSANNQGNSFSTHSVYEDRLQAPAVSAPAVYASGPCSTGGSLGLAGPGFGISGGRTKADANCDRREAARVLLGVNPALALKVMCSDPYVKEVATPADCMLPAAPTATMESRVEPAPTTDLNKYATKDELAKAFKQSMSK